MAVGGWFGVDLGFFRLLFLLLSGQELLFCVGFSREMFFMVSPGQLLKVTAVPGRNFGWL